MATPYSDIAQVFLRKITDYDLPKFSDIEKEEIVYGYLDSACANFYKKCKVNLLDKNKELKQFNEDLEDSIIEILSELMIVEWLKPKVLSTENLRNCMSTKDYSLYSPANLLKEIRETFNLCKKESKILINNYTFENADLTRLIHK